MSNDGLKPLPKQLTPSRLPRVTQKVLLSAASFLTWHGSQVPVARDPSVNATYSGQLSVKRPSMGQHPCYSGLQVQGTAISPAARKYCNSRSAQNIGQNRLLSANEIHTGIIISVFLFCVNFFAVITAARNKFFFFLVYLTFCIFFNSNTVSSNFLIVINIR